jgi:hypothetical protein
MTEPVENHPEGINYDREIASGWSNLDNEGRADYQQQFDALKRRWDDEKEAAAGGAGMQQTPTPAGLRDEDVEMGDEGDSHSGGDGGGFTAVNGSGVPPRMGNF